MKQLSLLLLVLLYAVPGFAQWSCRGSLGSAPYFGCTNVSATGGKLWAPGSMDLAGQSNIFHYAPTPDAPAGAWIHVNASARQSLAVTLPQALQAGLSYKFFLWAYDYDSGSAGHGGPGCTFAAPPFCGKSVSFTIGGATSNTVTMNDRDANGIWTPAATVRPLNASANLLINIDRNPLGDPTAQRSNILGVWWTTNSSGSVDVDSFLANLTPPTATDQTAVKGNYVGNGSFENPLDSTWAWYNTRKDTPAELRQTSCDGGAHSGNACLKIPLNTSNFYNPAGNYYLDTQLRSRAFHLVDNRKYTASVWAKTSSGTVTVGIEAKNTYAPPTGYAPQVSASNSASIGTNWTRLPVTWYAKAYPTADYTIAVTVHGNFNLSLYLDDIQLEEGDVSNYGASQPVDLILSSSHAGNVYYDTDAQTATVNLYNSTGTALTRTLRYEVYDDLLHQITAGSLGVTVGANTQTTTTINVNPNNRHGVFHVLYWQDGIDGTDNEFVFSNVRPCTGSAATSSLGTHINFKTASFNVFSRLCYKWVRTLSPGGQGRWEYAEPTEGNFVWQDSEISGAINSGFKVLMTLHSNNYGAPTYGFSGGVPISAKWQAFVEAMVAHYSALGVHDYEVWNEPNAVMSAAVYAEVLYVAVTAIHAKDSSGQPHCFGGVTSDFVASTLTTLAMTHPNFNPYTQCATFATHVYAGNDTDPFGKAYGGMVNLENTESGGKDDSTYIGRSSSFLPVGEPFLDFQVYQRYQTAAVKGPTDLTTSYARTIGSGYKRWFQYDARDIDPESFRHAFSALWKDFTPKAKAVAVSILSSYIDHTTAIGDASSSNSSFFLVYDTGSDPVAFLFSSDHAARQVQIANSITHDQLSVLDRMGNAVTFSGTTVPYGRLPVIVKGVGISASTLKAGLMMGTVSTRSDNTAPNVIFADCPRTTVAAGITIRCRWVGIDEQSYPSDGEYDANNFGVGTVQSDPPNPIATQFAYQLDSQAWSNWGQTTFVDLTNLSIGNHTFSVKMKDEAGNVSAIVSRNFSVAGKQ